MNNLSNIFKITVQLFFFLILFVIISPVDAVDPVSQLPTINLQKVPEVHSVPAINPINLKPPSIQQESKPYVSTVGAPQIVTIEKPENSEYFDISSSNISKNVTTNRIIFSDNFENGLTNWVIDKYWSFEPRDGSIIIDNKRFNSDSHSAKFSNYAENIAMTTKNSYILEGSNPALNFWIGGKFDFDYFYVKVKDVHDSSNNLFESIRVDKEISSNVRLDLRKFSGKPITITLAGLSENMPEFWIDDVMLISDGSSSIPSPRSFSTKNSIFSDNFENGLNEWIIDKYWNFKPRDGSVTIDNRKSYSPLSSARFSPYAENIAMTTKNSYILEGSNPTLNLWIGGKFDTDYFYVEVKDIHDSSNHLFESIWVDKEISSNIRLDLRKFSGKAVTVTFAGLSENMPEFWIDDVKLTSDSYTPTVGSLSATSSPPGAFIWIDNKNTGFKTPATVPSIQAGTHDLKLTKTGYLDFSQSITITGGQTTAISATLYPLPTPTPTQTPAYGSLSITSTPSGASIWIDNTQTSYTTPATIGSLPAGQHNLKLTKEGFYDFSQEITINPGQTTAISVPLVPVPTPTPTQSPTVSPTPTQAYGSLFVDSSPVGANIWIDNSLTSSVTPATFPSLTPGQHSLKLNKEGYSEYSQSFIIVSGQVTTISITLLQGGVLTVTSRPSGASVWIDGTDTGKQTPASISTISAGEHNITLLKPGYSLYSKVIEIKSGKTTKISAVLKTNAGNIKVTSKPSGAKILIDNTDTGLKTPKTIKDIAPGFHSIRLLKDRYQEWTQNITVYEKKTSTVAATLKPIGGMNGSIIISSNPSSATISIDGIETGFVTPKTLADISPGKHTVSLSKEGYQEWSKSVMIKTGGKIRVNGNLVRINS